MALHNIIQAIDKNGQLRIPSFIRKMAQWPRKVNTFNVEIDSKNNRIILTPNPAERGENITQDPSK